MKAEVYVSCLLCQVIPQTGALKKSLPKFKLSGYLRNKEEIEAIKDYFMFFFFLIWDTEYYLTVFV